ncbi:hypothetical protein AAZV13_09G206600 [Glycine max]
MQYTVTVYIIQSADKNLCNLKYVLCSPSVDKCIMQYTVCFMLVCILEINTAHSTSNTQCFIENWNKKNSKNLGFPMFLLLQTEGIKFKNLGEESKSSSGSSNKYVSHE